jgi:hypothetical protein
MRVRRKPGSDWPKPIQLPLFAEVACLVRLRPERGEWRFYCIEVWPDLFGRAILAGAGGGSAPQAACNWNRIPILGRRSMPWRMCATPNGARAIGIKRREPAAGGKAEDAESNDTRTENHETHRKSGEGCFSSTNSEAACYSTETQTRTPVSAEIALSAAGPNKRHGVAHRGWARKYLTVGERSVPARSRTRRAEIRTLLYDPCLCRLPAF